MFFLSGATYFLTETKYGLIVKYAVSGLVFFVLLTFIYEKNNNFKIPKSIILFVAFLPLWSIMMLWFGYQASFVSTLSFIYPIVTGYLAYELVKSYGYIDPFFTYWNVLAIFASIISVIFFILISQNIVTPSFNETEPILRLEVVGGIHRDLRMAFWFNEANYFGQFLLLPFFYSISNRKMYSACILALGIWVTFSLSVMIALFLSIALVGLKYRPTLMVCGFLISIACITFLDINQNLFSPQRQWSISEKIADYTFLLNHLHEYPLGQGFADINSLGKKYDVNLASGLSEPILYFGWVGVVTIVILLVTLVNQIIDNKKLNYLQNGTLALAIASLVHGPLLSVTFIFLYLISFERELSQNA